MRDARFGANRGIEVYIYIYIYCRGSVQMIWPLMKESTWMEARYN